MIQRVQSVYLFLVTVLQVILLMSDIATYIDERGETICRTTNLPIVAALTSLTAIIPAISMFLYRKRILQMRFNIFNSILLAALQGFIIYYVVSFYRAAVSFSFSITSTFSIISIILSILAIRNILKDELLIRSLNRIRR
ncbi:MAG: DUF4293 domain-containing protein [Prevotellaceae bacterium]|nr:DUF4293 domain-containing protein [Prevotellaceae bacterium]